MYLKISTCNGVEIGLQTEREGKTRIQVAMETFQLAKVAADTLRQTLGCSLFVTENGMITVIHSEKEYVTSSTVRGYLEEEETPKLPVETVDDDVTTARVKKQIVHRQFFEKRCYLREGVTASISIVTETLHEAAATASEEKETEKNRCSGMKRVGVENKDSRDVVGWKVILQEVELKDAGGHEKHPSLLVDLLTFLYGSRLSSQFLSIDYVCGNLLGKQGGIQRHGR